MFRVKSSFKTELEIKAPIGRIKDFFSDLSNFTELLAGVEGIRREPGGVARWTIATDTPVGRVRLSLPVVLLLCAACNTGNPRMSAWHCMRKSFCDAPPSTRSTSIASFGESARNASITSAQRNAMPAPGSRIQHGSGLSAIQYRASCIQHLRAAVIDPGG